jgi:hypothetical protein
MTETILLLILLLVLMLILLGFLIFLMSIQPSLGKWFEAVGYIFLVISLGWTILFNITNDMSTDTDLMIINEKLDNLWRFNKDLSEYIEKGSFNELQKSYYELSEYITDLEEGTEYFENQEKIIKNTHAALLILSTLLIACGRGQELINSTIENIKKRKKEKKLKKR